MTFVIISLGICSIISQFVLLRELQTTFQGNELSLSLILFCWLGGSGLGGFLSRYLLTQKRNPSTRRFDYPTILGSLFLFNSLWFFIGIFLSRSVKLLLSIPNFEILQPQQMLLISGLIILPQTIVFGLSFLLLCSIINNPLKAYYQEALGAFFAGILSLLLIKYLDSAQIIWIISLLSFLCAVSLIKNKRPFFRLAFIIALIIYIYLPVSGLLSKFQNYTQSFRFRPESLVVSTDSIYANIAISKKDNQYNLYENGSLLFTTEDTESIEEFAHLVLLNHPNPKKILLIGQAVSGSLSEIVKHPIESADYLEPDAKLIETAIKHIPQAESYGLKNEKVNIYNQDAASFTKKTATKYDLVILNLGNPSSLQLNRFYTVEFFRQIKKILSSDGHFSLAFSSKEDILTGDMLKYNRSLFKTAKSVFSNVKIIPGERLILICSLKFGRLNSEELIERFAERKIQAKYFTAQHIKAKLLRKEYIEKLLSGEDEDASLNYNYSPYGFFYYLGLWGKQSWLNFKKIWEASNRLNLTAIALFTLLLAFIFRKNILDVAIFSTGFTGIALEIIISFIFQINFGFLYYRLGAIIASFMLGLSLGGVISMQLTKRNQLKMLFYLEILLALSAIAIYFFLKQNQAVYFLATLSVGGLAGMEFGIFCSRKKTPTVYALDLAGSCLGALLVGLVFIPVLGIFRSCVALSLSKFTLCLFLRRQMR